MAVRTPPFDEGEPLEEGAAGPPSRPRSFRTLLCDFRRPSETGGPGRAAPSPSRAPLVSWSSIRRDGGSATEADTMELSDEHTAHSWHPCVLGRDALEDAGMA